MYHNFSNCRKTKYNPKVYVLPFSLFSVLINISQRLCFCSSALPKPRPVPDTKRGTKITLITYTSTRYCRSILLATCALLPSAFKSVVSVSSRCRAIELIVTVHGCPFAVHLLFVPETWLWNWTSAGATLENLSFYNYRSVQYWHGAAALLAKLWFCGLDCAGLPCVPLGRQKRLRKKSIT